MRKVVCAALKAKDGDVLLGIRHYSKDMVEQISNRKDGEKFHNLYGENQGFVDQYGNYLTREEAYIIAKNAGQLKEHERCKSVVNGKPKLFSEMLY